MKEKTKMLHFKVTPKELERINTKRNEIGVHNMSAYLRKMAMDGYCLILGLSDVSKTLSEASSLLRYCSNNLNQYAKKANETGSIYAEDINDLKRRLDGIWNMLGSIYRKLSTIK